MQRCLLVLMYLHSQALVPFQNILNSEGWSHGSGPVDAGFRDRWVLVSPEVVAELLKSILRSESAGCRSHDATVPGGVDKGEYRYFLEGRFPSQIRTD